MENFKMSCKEKYKVFICERNEIKDFIEKYHYSKNINGLMSDFCFKMIDIENNQIVGGMIYGKLGMANTWKKYAKNPSEIIELRRLCCIDETLKNAESYFIGKTIKWIKKNTNIKYIISYADLHYGHEGIIYKATNFEFLGKTQKSKVIIHGDKIYHDKAIRTKYNGKLKPFAERLKNALETGDAYYEERKQKNIYFLKLRNK